MRNLTPHSPQSALGPGAEFERHSLTLMMITKEFDTKVYKSQLNIGWDC